jgi:hypothetical protein
MADESGLDECGIAQSLGCDQVFDRVSMTDWKETGVRLLQGEDLVVRNGERGSTDEIGAAGMGIDAGGIDMEEGSISGSAGGERGRLAGCFVPVDLQRCNQGHAVGSVQGVGSSLQVPSEDQITAHNSSYDDQQLSGEHST